MAKYFRITEIDAATFERMTGSELDCLQVAMLADDGNVYVAVDEDRHDCIDVDLEMFDDIGGGPLIEERIHNRGTALSVLEELDAAPTVDAVEVVRCKDCLCRRTSTAQREKERRMTNESNQEKHIIGACKA